MDVFELGWEKRVVGLEDSVARRVQMAATNHQSKVC